MPRAKTRDTKSAAQPKAASNAKIMDYYHPAGPKDAPATTNGNHCAEEAPDGLTDRDSAPLKTITKAKKQQPPAPSRATSAQPAEKAPETSSSGEVEAGGRRESAVNGYPAVAVTVKCEPEASPLPAAVASAAAQHPDTQRATTAAAPSAEQSAAEPPWLTVTGRKKKKSGPSKTTDVRRLPNRLVTDFFPARRSDRTTAKEQKDAAAEALRQKIEAASEDGLKVVTFTGKGRGVVAERPFKRGDFVVEYAGDLIDQQEARAREKEYTRDDRGCYMYYFSYKNKHYCVDATDESGRLGRLLNHSKQGNCSTKLVEVNGQPRLIIVAARDIEADEELLYDYGDRSKTSLELHPWLKA